MSFRFAVLTEVKCNGCNKKYQTHVTVTKYSQDPTSRWPRSVCRCCPSSTTWRRAFAATFTRDLYAPAHRLAFTMSGLEKALFNLKVHPPHRPSHRPAWSLPRHLLPCIPPIVAYSALTPITVHRKATEPTSRQSRQGRDERKSKAQEGDPAKPQRHRQDLRSKCHSQAE